MALLALAAPQVRPSPGVKESLMRQIVGFSTGRGGTLRVMPAQAPGTFAGWMWALVPLAGGFACAIVFGWLHIISSINRLRRSIIACRNRTRRS